MTSFWIKLGSFFMFAAVTLGAFGSHALKGKLSDDSLDVYKTAVLYHFIHAIGILFVAWLSSISGDAKITYAGWAFVCGVLLFSGSLYALAITHIKILGAVTPLGGLAFLSGWLLIFLSHYK